MDKIILPNFLCIGAPKSGTTSLYNILQQHPEIGMSSFKEPHFFDNRDNWLRGVKWYSSTYFSSLKQNMIGEFTPSYLANEFAAKRIKETLGENVKFIVLLRNPVDRAYSHYLHSKRDLFEKESFLGSLQLEHDRLKKFRENGDDVSIAKFCYVHSGKYSLHFKEYLNFFNRKQFCIILFDDFINDTPNSVLKILNFLNVDSSIKLDCNFKSNVASIAKSKTLKKLMKQDFFIKKFLKRIITSSSLRQKIRNKIQAVNNKPADVEPLTDEHRLICYEKYFKSDIEKLEENLLINLKKWKLC